MSKLSRTIHAGNSLESDIYNGLDKAYSVAKAAYGPKAGNALLEQNYGDPLLSRDGVTNIRRLYVDNPVENMVIRTVVQASNNNNKTAGDGTTAVIILTYHLYAEAIRLIAGGYNRMEVAQLLRTTAQEVLDQINPLVKTVDDEILEKVCKVSSGDEAIGMLVADIIKQVGADGGVTVENFAGAGIYSDIVDGFYFNKGFTQLSLVNDPSNLESRHIDVPLLISEKRLLTVADIAPILDTIASSNIQDLILVGEVGPEVLEMLLLNRMKGIINVVPVDVPVYEGMRSLFLDDLALVTGGKVIQPGTTASEFQLGMLGYAKKVVINEFSTTIIGADGSSEDVLKRVRDLQEQLEDASAEVTQNALRDRISRLTGKVALVKVGGVTEFEQAEIKLRVEDAICAGQAAAKNGVVPGGGVSLARVKTKYFNDAFKQPFKQLCDNAGLNAERMLGDIEKAKHWYGFNLKDISENPIDLMKAGVIDPALVVEEIVKNATSVVAGLITTTVALTFADRTVKND